MFFRSKRAKRRPAADPQSETATVSESPAAGKYLVGGVPAVDRRSQLAHGGPGLSQRPPQLTCALFVEPSPFHAVQVETAHARHAGERVVGRPGLLQPLQELLPSGLG